jgi:hypothetical protein
MDSEKWPSLVRPSLTPFLIEEEANATKPQIDDPGANPYTLSDILDGYSEEALITMVTKRGLGIPWERGWAVSPRKPRADTRKRQLIFELAATFYDEVEVERVMAALSPAARFGLGLLIREGGLMRRGRWLMEIGEHYGAAGITQTEQELVGSALALYAGTDSRGGEVTKLRFRSAYASYLHQIGQPSFIAESWLYVPSSIRSHFKPDATLLAQLTPVRLQPYDGEVSRVAQVATHNLNVLLTDLFSFIRYIEQEKFRIVQSGSISKRDIAKLLALLSRSGMNTTPATSPEVVAQVYNRARAVQLQEEVKKRLEQGWLDFVWNILKQTDLIEETEEGSQTTAVSRPQSIEEFYALPDYFQARQLTVAWLEGDDNEFWRIPTLYFQPVGLYAGDNGDVPPAFKLSTARQLVLIQLQNFLVGNETPEETELVAGNNWLDLNSFLALIHERYPEILVSRRELIRYSYGRQEGVAYQGFTSTLKGVSQYLRLELDWRLVEGEWLIQLFREALGWLGLAELGLDAEGRPVAFRLTELGKKVLLPAPPALLPAAEAAPLPERSLIVQPNFEILVLNPLHRLDLLRKLDAFALQLSLGDAALYRLSKESILNGLRAGLSGPEIVSFLEQESAVPLAQNLIASILEWGTSYERLTLRVNSTLLEVADPQILDRLMQDPDKRQRLGLERRLTPTVALLSSPPPPPVIEKALEQPSTLAGASKNTFTPILPLYFNYGQIQTGTLNFEGDRKLVVKRQSGQPYLYYRLGQFADLVEWDASRQSATFVLSREAGERAQRLGLDYSKVAAFLAEWKKPRSELPPAFELRLKIWLGYFGRLKREQAVPIRAARTEQLDNLFKLPELAGMLLERVSATVALVKAEEFERFEKRLAELDLFLG